MQCPSCKETIDDDSRYCDQCGEQILVCSVCGRAGKGKRCIFDGKEMVPVGGGTAPPQATQTEHVDLPPPVQATPPSPPAPQSPAAANKIKLSSPSRSIIIEASDGDIIGRKNGPFAGTFGGFSHVSGTHCKLIKKDGKWYIQDMGSTNGTFYNNSRLAPDTPVPVANNTSVKIADIELMLTFDSNDGGTTRI